MTRVRVRRERPTLAAWAVALVVTMLVVYVLTLNASVPVVVESVSAAPRVTRQVTFDALERWCVSMGCWEDADRARIEAAGCASGGAAGFLMQVDGSWHVLGAMFDNNRDARRAADKAAAAGWADASVLCLEAGSVELRVTAPERQVDAIAAADAALCGQIAQLGTIARQLDESEIQADGARTLCALASTETGRAAQALADIPGAPENALCAALIENLAALSEQLDGIAASGQTAPTALAGMLRLSQIDAFVRLRALRQSLLSGRN